MMSSLSITTLGELAIVHGDTPCRLPLGKTLALALFLAVTGQPHTRARLAALFWPAADEAHGLLSVRQTLLRLRQALGSDADAHLLTTGELVRLTLGLDGWLDVTALAGATAATATLSACQAALQSYAGPFLSHLHLDDAPDFTAWMTAQRAHWETCYDIVAERVVFALLDEGSSETACQYGQTWVMRRPDCEAAYRALATAHASRGDRASARLTLDMAARALAALGFDLSRETEAVRERLTQDATADVVSHALRLPLVGRQAPFAALRMAYVRAQAGQVGVAWVLAEAGLGKSRLVEAFLHWAELHGADVAAGHAYELSGRLPYQALMELLRERLDRERAPEDLLADSWLSELQRLVPDLHDRYPDLPAPVDDPAAGTRLVEALAHLGLALARRHPLVWFIDDLHWADEATRDALLTLLGRWQAAHAPVLLVVTLRREEVATQPALAPWRAAVARIVALTEVPLAPLTSAHTAQALTLLLADHATAELCAWLHAQTAGNPLYLEHVLQALVERGLLHWHADKLTLVATVTVPSLAAWLPDTLRSLLLRRIYRLEADVQQVLGAAAIMSGPFTEDLLRHTLAVGEDTVVTALEAAERAMLIRPDGSRYRFAHDQVAEAIANDLTPARRRLYHRRALAALEVQSAVPPATKLPHALGAEAWKQAATYGLMAAEAAVQLGALREAVYFYEHVQTLMTIAPSATEVRPHLTEDGIMRIYAWLAHMYTQLNDLASADAVYQQALADARARGAHLLEGRILGLLGRFALLRDHDVATAQVRYEAARQIAQEQGDLKGLLNVEEALAQMLIDQEQWTAAEPHTRSVVDLARATQQAFALCLGFIMESLLAMHQGQWEAMCVRVEASLLVLAGVRDDGTGEVVDPPPYTQVLDPQTWRPRLTARLQPTATPVGTRVREYGRNSLYWLGVARLHVGDGAAARAALTLWWQLATERGEQYLRDNYALAWVTSWLEGGMFAHVLAEATRLQEWIRRPPQFASDPLTPLAACASADIALALLRLDDASIWIEYAAAIVHDGQARPLSRYRLLPVTRRCTQQALAGQWAAAYEAASEAQHLRDGSNTSLAWFDLARYHETEACLRAGDRSRAEAGAQHLHAHLGTNHRFRLVWLRMQALLERHAGDHVAAREHLAEAQGLAHLLDLPGEAWQLANEQSACHLALGDAASAQAARASAEGGITHLAATITDPALREHFIQAALAHPPALSD